MNSSSTSLNNVNSSLRRRLTNFSSALTNRLWINAHTNYQGDVLMTFSTRIDDYALIWFLEQLIELSPDIHLSIKYHFTTGVYGFYVTFSYEKILKGAHDLHLQKPIKQEYGGGYKTFIFDELDFYEGVENEKEFLTSQERQSIVRYLLFSIKILRQQEINGIKFKVDQSLVQRGIDKKFIHQVIPLHNKEILNDLRDKWVWPKSFFKRQPIEDIRQYFGVKIAFYFCWISFYTKALCLPAFYGLIIWFYTGRNEEFDDRLFVINTLLNIIWATGFLILWRRKQAELAYQWNTLDMEPIEEIRATFKGELHRSPITNQYEPYYPAWKRLIFRLFVTIPMLCINIILVSCLILLIIRFQSWIDRQLKAERLPHLMSLTDLLPKILLALVTTVFSDVYKRICRWLNNRENYREQREYDNQMIAKLFACSCVNSYFSVFYIAFFTHKHIRLSHQLVTIFVMKQFWGNIKEAIVPYIVSNTRLSVLIQLSKNERTRYAERKQLNKELKRVLDERYQPKTNPIDSRQESQDYSRSAVDATLTDSTLNRRDSTPNFETLSLSQAEIECSQPKWPDLHDDYLEIVVQFGYIIFLSTLFPLAAFFSLLNNILEIRTDAFKLCMIYQRPFSQRVKDIGHWQKIMEYMIIVAIIINCIFCSIRGVFRRLIPDLPFAAEIFLLVCIEHVLIGVCQIIRSSIQSIPYWVRVEKSKMEYRRREALKKFECDTLHRKESRSHTLNE